MSRAKFKVAGEDFDKAKTATVVISRMTNMFSVRPSHRHRTYVLPLATVAQMVLWKVIKGEAEAKMLASGMAKRLKRVKRGKV